MGKYYQGQNNSPQLIIVTVTLAIVAVILASWRIAYRARRRALALTDYLLVIGMILALCQAGLNLGAYTIWGYGHHKDDIPLEILSSTTPKLLFWINQILFKLTTGIIKLSICVIYMGIFRQPAILSVHIAQISNYVLMTVVGHYYLSATFVSAFQCNPVHKAWQPDQPGRCIENDPFRLVNGYINCITSIWLIVLPFPALLMIERRSRELLEFLGLVSLGLIHTGCAIWRVAIMYIPDPEAAKDPYWANTDSNTVAMTELFVGIIAATIIVMRQSFYTLGKTVRDSLSTLSTLSMTPRNIEASYVTGSRFGLHRLTAASIRGYKGRGHGVGSGRIAVTTEIAMETQDRSTEDLFVAGSESHSVYHRVQ